jgi:hypothetical protein
MSYRKHCSCSLLLLGIFLACTGCQSPFSEPEDSGFVPVSGIEGLPPRGVKGAELNLSTARAVPDNATHRDIDWAVEDGGTTGISSLDSGRATPSSTGRLKLRARIPDGKAEGEDYTQVVVIPVVPLEGFVPVSAINQVPAAGVKNRELNLNAAVVAPAEASLKTILWTLTHAGSTGLSQGPIPAGKLSPTASGELKVQGRIADGGEGEDYVQDFTITITDSFVSVSAVSGLPLTGAAGSPLDLNVARVEPETASAQTITWTLLDAGSTGVKAQDLSGGVFTPLHAGELSLRALVKNGINGTGDYTQDFTITITADFVPVSRISGIPDMCEAGTELDLNGARVEPENASARTITWTLLDAGSTGAQGLSGGILIPPNPGNLVLKALIPRGKSSTEDYTETFQIAVFPQPVPETPRSITGLTILSPPDLTLYAKNQPFSSAGLRVALVYNDGGLGDELAAAAYTVDPVDTAVPGQKRIYVRSGTYPAVYFTIYVDTSDKLLQNITLTSPPAKTEYVLGEDFSTSGMVITGSYSDGSSKTLSGAVSGYDKYLRGRQAVSVAKIAGKTLSVDITVKVPAIATVQLNHYQGASVNHQTAYYKGVYLKDKAFDFARSNLKATVKAGDISVIFSPGKGLYPEDVQGFNPHQTGVQNPTLNLDTQSLPFEVYVADTEPAVYFDYGYLRQASDPQGKGPGAGKYFARIGETLVLSPVRSLIGYNDDHSPATVSYSWSVSGGSWNSGVSTGSETFAFTPQALGTYTVQVSVTGRNYVTGGTGTLSASTQVVCYDPQAPGPTEGTTLTVTGGKGQYIRNFASGQFSEGGNGYGWSLGSAMGYELWAVEHQASYRISGNPMGNWSESGIVWVMEDRNNNHIPDEMWYEIAGSDETHPVYAARITRRYSITYYKSADTGVTNSYGQLIRTVYWTDSRGRSGIIPGGWPSPWGVNGDWATYTGTLLRDDGNIATGEYSGLENMGGYVDTFGYGKWYDKDTWDRVFLSDAIRADGSPVSLSNVRFIKVQTAIHRYGGVFGDVSTEINSADFLGSQTDFANPAGGR